MAEQNGQRDRRINQSNEEVGLTISKVDASCLRLILQYWLDDSEFRANQLPQILNGATPEEKNDILTVEGELTAFAEQFAKELDEVVMELEIDEKKPQIIKPPSWT